MTMYYLENWLLGRRLTDEQMEDVPHPRFELHVHVLYKTVQTGAILGLVIGPLVGAIRGRSLTAVRQTAMKGFKMGAVIGIPAGPAMTEMTLAMRKADDHSVYDRSYRLRYNKYQILVDRLATFGGIAGGSGAMVMGKSLVPGGLVGFVAGTVIAGVYNNFILPNAEEKKS